MKYVLKNRYQGPSRNWENMDTDGNRLKKKSEQNKLPSKQNLIIIVFKEAAENFQSHSRI
jgi:hypothetical protein